MDETASPHGRNPVMALRYSFSTRDMSRSSSVQESPRIDAKRGPRVEQSLVAATSLNSVKKFLDDGETDHRYRDSLRSIRDDPFFRNYQSPYSVALARELRSATHIDRKCSEYASEDPNSRSVQTVGGSPVKLPLQSRSGMADINVAVVGYQGVGKSVLIQRAFSLRTLPTSVILRSVMPVENVLYTVSLIEIDLETFDIIHDQRIQWPKQINGQILPPIDGALLLYDVINEESAKDLHQTMSALVRSLVPTVLVSTKCDNPESARHVNVGLMESGSMANVECVKTAENVPESARMCLSTMLRAITENRNAAKADTIFTRAPTRTQSTPNLENSHAAEAGSPLSEASKQSGGTLAREPPPSPSSSRAPALMPTSDRTNPHYQTILPGPSQAPSLLSHPALRPEPDRPALDSRLDLEQVRQPLVISTDGKPVGKTFLDMEESDAELVYRDLDDTPILQRNDDSFFNKPATVAGVSFDELVDRLLAQPMARADHNFLDIFLCLYRKFAAPGELFNAIMLRLERLMEEKTMQYLIKITIQLRIITIVAKWVTNYPGDFAGRSTYCSLDTFINNLSNDPIFAVAGQEMRVQLHSRVVGDDDTDWAKTDADVETGVRSLAVSNSQSPMELRRHHTHDFASDLARLKLVAGDPDMKRKGSSADCSSLVPPPSPAESLSAYFNTVEDYEREAATMTPKSTLRLSKPIYHKFMENSEDAFAKELTRIDWVMFSSIRLRDFIRHVSLPLSAKEKCHSLANVDRMINHFNHIAKWVANMILIRDKAKHRALMLDKFIQIACKLRQLNNYNGLAAILAGINGSAIYRMSATRALVPADAQKRFATLVLLMGTRKSHFAYRLAWENSPLPRIPFVPLLRRDLVSAEEGSRTFVGSNGDRINWKKFEVLSEVILPIMRSRVHPYARLERSEGVRELILNCDMPEDDEDIYQRSVQAEPLSGTADSLKKKFPWFQKDR